MKRKSHKARQAARGQPCLMNVAKVCCYDNDRTVLIHLRWLGDCGTGFKPGDWQAVYACDCCNAWTDNPTPRQLDESYECDRNFYAARALARMRKLEWAA